MSNDLILFVPEDKTGTKQENLIVDEEHVLDPLARVIKPHLLAYYSDSIVVKHIDSNSVETTLNKNIDYTCTDILEKISSKIGKEICCTILFKNNSYNKVKITYQAYGGLGNPNLRGIAIAMMQSLQKNPISWNSIIDKPIGFNPTPNHLHDWLDLYGLEYLQQAILRIDSALINKPTFSSLDLGNKIQNLFIQYPINGVSFVIDDTHIKNQLNIHRTTKAHIDLVNVENLRTTHSYSLIDLNDLENSTYYKEYLLSTEYKYITNYPIKYFTQERSQANTDLFFNISGSSKSIFQLEINNLDTRAGNINTFVTNNQSSITQFNSEINTLFSSYNSLNDFIKQYKYFNWNKEVADVLKIILEHKYQSTTNYQDIINVPAKLELPYLWLDFSDTSTMSVVSNTIASITDKSVYARQYVQNTASSRPALITKTNVGTNEINRNTVANLSLGKKLIQSVGETVNLNSDFTIIILTREKTSESIILSNTNVADYRLADDKLSTHVNSSNSIKLSTEKYKITSQPSTSYNFKTNLNVLTVTDKDNTKNYHLSNNKSFNNVYPLGLFENIKNNTDINYVTFNVIGDINDSVNHDYELCEIIIYKRVFSKVEIDVLCKYLSRKHSGAIDFSMDYSFLSNL
jgi:hypothetical protein